MVLQGYSGFLQRDVWWLKYLVMRRLGVGGLKRRLVKEAD